LTNLLTATTLPIKSLLLSLLILNLLGCSSKKNPVVYHHSFDFSQITTYSFYKSDSRFFDSQSLSHSQRNRLEIAIERSLNKQDFTYSDIDNADIIVTYHLAKGKSQDYQNYNKAIRFCTHCLKANAWQKENNDWHVYRDGLILDLVNPKTNRSVWRSIYPLEFKDKDSSTVQNEKIMAAVDIMLTQYPGK